MRQAKVWLILGIILLSLSVGSLPVYAFDPLNPTDNATAQYVFTDNFSITSDNFISTFGGPLVFSIDLTAFTTALETGMTNAGKASAQVIADEISHQVMVLITLVVSIMIMLGLAALGYWRGDRGLFVVSGLAFILYSFSYWSTSWQFGLLLGLAGAIIFLRAFSSKGRE